MFMVEGCTIYGFQRSTTLVVFVENAGLDVGMGLTIKVFVHGNFITSECLFMD